MMLQTVVLSALASSVLGLTLDRRIAYGTEVSPAFSYPYMVGISYGGDIQCGGGLYGSEIVITAAHCIKYPIDIMDFHIHRHDQRKSEEEEESEKFKAVAIRSVGRNVDNVYLLEGNMAVKILLNDIAIVKLDRPSRINSNLQLADEDLSGETGSVLHLTGWGQTKVLNEDDYPIYNMQKCLKKRGVLPEYNICIGYEDKKNIPISGDSGSPLVRIVNGQPILVGVMVRSRGQGMGDPAVAERIDSYRQWILDTIDILLTKYDYNLGSPRKGFNDQELAIHNSAVASLKKNHRPYDELTYEPPQQEDNKFMLSGEGDEKLDALMRDVFNSPDSL